MSEAVQLADVPERFLDKLVWQQMLDAAPKRNKTIALSFLNAPYPCDEGFISEFWTSPIPGTSRDHIAIYQAGRTLLSQSRSLFSRGELIAIVDYGEPDSYALPREQWCELYPMFATGQLKGRKQQFTNVWVIQNLPNSAEQLLSECLTWLKGEQANGNRLKKVLWPKAVDEFGKKLTHQIFDAAYKLVFNSLRGRPERPRKLDRI